MCGDRFKDFFLLVLEFEIPIKDKRKYNSLVKSIPVGGSWSLAARDPYDLALQKLLQAKKVPKFAYPILKSVEVPGKKIEFWNKLFEANTDTDEWSRIHTCNFKCTMETQLKSFYFKFFHKAIATNDFLSKIGRSDTSLCSLCNKDEDSIQHFLIFCESVTPIWYSLERYLCSNLKETLNLSHFEKLFGVNQSEPHSSCINFFLLCTKFFIYRCKFQKVQPSFQSLLSFIRVKQKTEYNISLKNCNLGVYFKKFIFNV